MVDSKMTGTEVTVDQLTRFVGNLGLEAASEMMLECMAAGDLTDFFNNAN